MQMKTVMNTRSRRMKKLTQNKKSNIIFISILAAVVIATVIFACLGLNKAKDLVTPDDLGVEYGKDDVDSLDDKLDIEFTVPKDDTSDENKDPDDILDNGTIGDDYTINYTEFTQKTITLNEREMTALLNERMPSLSFFKSSQIKANADKSISFTSTCDIRKALPILFPTLEVTVPDSTPTQIPFGATLNATVKDNTADGKLISLDSLLLNLLPIKVGQEFTADISPLFSSTPELHIDDMHIDGDGMFVITGNLPTKAEIIPIQ